MVVYNKNYRLSSYILKRARALYRHSLKEYGPISKTIPTIKQNFSNEGQEFLAWYLRSCYLRTPVRARDDITDGPNDKEFDAVIVDDEKRQIVIA